jgi:hypothetical protein
MFEQIKTEMGNTPIRIEYAGGRIKCGVVIDYMELEKVDIGNWKFISYNNLSNYERTENPHLVEKIEERNIISIDILLK